MVLDDTFCISSPTRLLLLIASVNESEVVLAGSVNESEVVLADSLVFLAGLVKGSSSV